MTKDFKERLREIKQQYNKVDDAFLNLFEKRYIIFIENGVDLKSDCKLFDSVISKKGWDH
jgi:sRNA-binding regulator protein Hfq